jgi:hypothetical protein
VQNFPVDGETGLRDAIKRPDRIIRFTPARARDPLRPTEAVERVAALMIARHGTNAAREATVLLNRMIDRHNLPARDLWACVVHVIHERRAS